MLSTAAACSSGSSGSTPQAQIERNWTTFFSNTSSTQERVAALEHGEQFRRVIEDDETLGLSQQVSATVQKVTVHGDTADVTYTVLRGSIPELEHVTGLAVLVDGVWKVSDRTLCALLALGAVAPPQCASASTSAPTS